jgi:putative ABC transport system permease protein
MKTAQESHGADGLVTSFLRDLRYAGRRLRNNLGFTTLGVLTLALGIGATTAVFSVVNGILLKSLPYPDSNQIVALSERTKSGGEMNVADPNFLDLHGQSHSFSSLAFYSNYPSTILGGSEPILAGIANVSTDFMSVFRVRPLMGRVFTHDETAPGGPASAVVSFNYWRDHLGSATDINSHILSVDGRSYQVVGVMPTGFHFPDATDVWLPSSISTAATRTAHNLQVVGRLKTGVSLESARTDLDLIYRRLKHDYGTGMDAYGFNINTLHDEIVGPVRTPLLLLLAAAVLVLLVACTNVASTLLAAGAARRGEIAVRAALGARRGRVLRQLTTEGLLLAMLGSAAGLALAAAVLKFMQLLAPAGALPQSGTISLDGRVVTFALAMGLLAAVLSSLFPAMRLSTESITHDLVTRGDVGGRGRVWGILVASEVAMALLLLVGCGLLVRSFAKVASIDPGFRSDGVLTADIALPQAKYPDDASIATFYQQILPELARLPGVKQAGMTHHLPLSGSGENGAFDIEGTGRASSYTYYSIANTGFFRSLGVPLKRGRFFDDRDRPGTPDVALVNETFAKQFFPGVDVVGRRVRNLANDDWVYGPDRWVTIVGVVADMHEAALTSAPKPTIYVNPYQRPFKARYASLTLQSTVPPESLVPAVQAILRKAAVPATFATMDSRLSGAVAGRRFSTSVLTFFAVIALLLAAIGIYGVVSYQVVQRTREIGIRIALGAQPASVRRLIVINSMRVVALGLVVGILATPVLTRALQSLLYDISPTDPGTFVTVLLVFVLVALAASLIPANRATRIAPMLALRSE